MALPVRRSILIQFLIVGWFVLPGLAQHRVIGAPVPAPAPPMAHAPAYHPPIYQPQIYRSPSYAPIYAPRSPSARSFRPMNTLGFRPPPRPIFPFRTVIVLYPFPIYSGPFWSVPFWPSTFCWWASCDQFWISSLLYAPAPLSAWNPVSYALAPASEPPRNDFGQEGPEFPQLFLKDGTILNVTDYWVVDGQLHFTMMEEEGTKPSEQVIPFDELDLQKTVDVNTNRGFHFMLRNEPFERYIHDHPDGTPPAIAPQ